MVPEELLDAELARRVTSGSAPEAERELVRRYAPRIRLYGLHHLRDEDRARDLVQEVLIAVIEALRADRVEDLERLPRFVLGTCRNVVSGWRRGARRSRDASALLAGTEPVTPAPRPPADSRRLLECMAGLSARDQSILVLSYCEERSADEIGRRFGLTAGNVRVLRHRALARVKTCLEARG